MIQALGLEGQDSDSAGSDLTPVILFKCLAEETRLRITLLLASEGELCVCELMAALEESQPKVSRHLALLRTQGVLADRRQGQWVYYRLNPALSNWVIHMLEQVLNSDSAWLEPNLVRLRQMHNRPDRVTLCR